MKTSQGRVEEIVAAITARDGAAIQSLLAPGVVLDYPYAQNNYPPAARGIEAVGQALSRVFDNFTQFDLVIDRLYASSGGEVIVEASSNAVRNDGQEYSNSYVIIWKFDETGRVSSWREYFNPTRLPVRNQPAASPADA